MTVYCETVLSWMFSGEKQTCTKEQSVVRNHFGRENKRTITTDVEDCIRVSEFLQDDKPETIALFHRKEIKCGAKLGQGTFSDVYEVTNFNLRETESQDLDENVCCARLGCEQAASQLGSRYAIKIPKKPERKNIFAISAGAKNSQDAEPIKFQEYARACVDLIMEGRYLAALSHPNIIEVRGLSRGPTPFIIVELLPETLDNRIARWKQFKTRAENATHLKRASWGPGSFGSLGSLQGGWKSTDALLRNGKLGLRRNASIQRSKSTSNKRLIGGSNAQLRRSSNVDFSAGEGKAKSNAFSLSLLYEKADYSLQIADALKYLHSHRIIVRDLKPSNIGFVEGEDGQDIVKLFDFGLCRELHEAQAGEEEFRMSVAGTLRYMSPEVINTGCYGLKADVYSWAILSYEMLTLQKPYSEMCATSEMHRRCVCRDGLRPHFPDVRTSREWVPLTLQKVVKQAWAQEASDRPSAAQICEKLSAFFTVDADSGAVHDRESSPPIPTDTIPAFLTKAASLHQTAAIHLCKTLEHPAQDSLVNAMKVDSLKAASISHAA